MSEAVSAFAAYKINSSKNVGKGKKGNAGGTAKGNAKTKGAAAGAKGKNSTTAKAKGASAAKGAKGAAGKDKPGKGAAANKTAVKNTAKATTTAAKTKAANSKPAPKNKAAGAKPAAKNGKEGAPKGKKSNGIHSSEVDQLVEQLLGDSASKTKKLSKEDKKKKQELEDYLVRQLEKEDGKYSSEESEDGDDYSTGSESGSDEFSDEFTLNSTGSFTDCSGEKEESDETGSGFETESASTDTEDMQASKEPKVSARKRKSKEGAGTQKQQDTAAVNGNSAAKKSKQAAEAKPSSSRKSLPVAKVQPAEIQRRSVGANSTTIEAAAISSTRNLGNIALKLEPVSPPASIVKMNSIKEGEKMFQWMLNPVTIKDFFAKYWERSACLVKRDHANYYAKLISFEAIDQMLLKNHVEFTKNIDITSYKNGVRETLNPEGRAMPPIVWDHYGQGCSIRLLNPHTFLPELCTMNTTLQEYFHCMVGTNAYLTPPNSQGFAPHYDDIEAFVLQIEGRKRWKLYSPRTLAENLPRLSSQNFTQQDIGKPILEVVLEPGDVLYFPRGTIHQASTEPGHHSLHITLSVYQKQSYADLFERLIPLMLQRAIADNVDMRRGLPLHTWRNAGIAFSDSDTKERAELVQKVSQLLNKSLRSAPVAELMDAAVDQVAKKFQHEALPPEILSAERVRTVFGSRSRINERGECVCDYEIDERTNVRLLRANIMRLVSEEDKIRIYYYLDNSKEYCEYEPNFMEVDPEQAGSVEVLIKSYPAYVGVAQLPLPSDKRKVELATALWERGLLMMERPFK